MLSGCKDPLGDDKKKPLVRTLLNESLPQSGKYIVYWNGKDDNGEYITPGKYIIILEVRDLQDTDFVTAVGGGKPGENNEGNVIPGFYINSRLEPPYPNPFEILSGVNIPFIVHEAGGVKLEIYKN